MGEYVKKNLQKVSSHISSIKIIIEYRGEWSLKEDLFILSFFEQNGSKWAKLSRNLQDRNEHNVKNRFFSLISKFLEMPIKIVKKKKII